MKRFILFILASLIVTAGALALASGSPSAIWGFVNSADPLYVIVLFAASLALSSFVAGMLTGDYSWVDRLWSTAPVVFVWYYLARSGFETSLLVASIVVTIWGVRLTYNFARKGGYSGEEDYRWPILRQRITNPLLWQLFNLFFISCFQIGMFVLFTLPAYILWQNPGFAGQPAFLLFVGLSLGAILFESLADRQQWVFHALKRQAKEGKDISASPLAEDVKRGFLSSGLFAHSRHPNYFGELSTWWMLALAAASVTGSLLHWSLVGPLLLTALFIGSTVFTEAITGAKYPEYAEYQKRVSPIVPWFAGKVKKEAETPSS